MFLICGKLASSQWYLDHCREGRPNTNPKEKIAHSAAWTLAAYAIDLTYRSFTICSLIVNGRVL
ncbi:hypothetical protein DDK22_31815 [Cupriavidus necator]|uniref:Uncharacterized protein n=1 Tax=Cupriavidus necator TaxID=106590 RepID=A0A367P9G1_CUPNE|nr:hypothetical protein DDK22_31815 [Cupriavidus necator]